ncbi:GDP-mannose 4,6-dehydratase [Candidatus Marinimicrobia bacterium]|nr:GDP-mannose 4,6-dehydratase [Candidatus Neomarinimicrobiota bacterium]
MKKEKILVTGCSGFIGMHLCRNLLEDGHEILGIDNMNDYYDVNLKRSRLALLTKFKDFSFEQLDISDYQKLTSTFLNFKPLKVVNLAAQAGVRYSLENPLAYINSNIVGFMNVLECCRYNKVKGLIYASSSSVYGGNKKIPFSIDDRVDKPISIYAATKKANELMAHTYSHLYDLNTTGLRFFTVYGPWGRPDMAMYIFTKKISSEKPIYVFNNGDMFRDFTYIDDIVSGLRSALSKNYKCEVFNLGNSKTEHLMNVIKIIEKKINIKAKIIFDEIKPGDVKKTFADIDYSKKKLEYRPKTTIEKGVPQFIDWYINFSK